MSEEKDLNEIFYEAFIELSKGIIDPNEEKKDYDLDIEFDERDVLQFEEKQELDEILEDMVDDISEGLEKEE